MAAASTPSAPRSMLTADDVATLLASRIPLGSRLERFAVSGSPLLDVWLEKTAKGETSPSASTETPTGPDWRDSLRTALVWTGLGTAGGALGGWMFGKNKADKAKQQQNLVTGALLGSLLGGGAGLAQIGAAAMRSEPPPSEDAWTEAARTVGNVINKTIGRAARQVAPSTYQATILGTGIGAIDAIRQHRHPTVFLGTDRLAQLAQQAKHRPHADRALLSQVTRWESTTHPSFRWLWNSYSYKGQPVTPDMARRVRAELGQRLSKTLLKGQALGYLLTFGPDLIRRAYNFVHPETAEPAKK